MTTVEWACNADDLAFCCFNFFLSIVNGPRRDLLDDSDLRRLRVQAQRFNLWRTGVIARPGGLNAILKGSIQMNETVLMLLSALAETLDEVAEKAVTIDMASDDTPNDDVPRISDRYWALRGKLLEYRMRLNQVSDDHEDSDDNDLTESILIEEPDPIDSIDPVGDVVSYNDLLADLVPTLSSSPQLVELSPSETVDTGVWFPMLFVKGHPETPMTNNGQVCVSQVFVCQKVVSAELHLGPCVSALRWNRLSSIGYTKNT
jgi:hypothetical protein